MMLTYTWFAVLVTVSIYLGYISFRDFDDLYSKSSDSGVWAVAALVFSAMSLFVIWHDTGPFLLDWLLENLPQKGSSLAKLTAIMLTGMASFIYVVFIPVVGGAIIFKTRRKP